MRIFIALSFLGFAFLTLSQALAQEPGDIGTVECREVQLQIQKTIEDTIDKEGPYKNHGQFVKAVVHLLKSARKEKPITGKCASCIFTQFVLRIHIKNQDACGPDMETEACFLSDDICEDIPEDDCIDRGGIPEGPGTDCASVSPNVIETVACCFEDYSCQDMTFEDCKDERGMPMPAGSNCDRDGFNCFPTN